MTRTSSFYPAVRSESANVSAAVPTTFKVFIQSAFVSVRDNWGREEMEVSNPILLEFRYNRSFSMLRFSEPPNPTEE
jgi:hypothetical protein